jgi:hypothetical protein
MIERGQEGSGHTDDIRSGGGGAGGETWQPQSPAEPRPSGDPAQAGARGGETGAAPGVATGEPGVATGGRGGAGEMGGAGGLGGGQEIGQGGAPAGGPHPEAGTGAGAGGAGGGGAAIAEPGGGPTDGQATAGGHGSTPLLSNNDASDFERRWQDVQVGFVDEPQRCVQDADALVAEVMQRLADGFAQERRNLESQWAGGGEASTEDLRIALQRYRSFFNRLLRTT